LVKFSNDGHKAPLQLAPDAVIQWRMFFMSGNANTRMQGLFGILLLRNSDIGWKNSILTQLSRKLYLHIYIVGGMIFLSPIQEKIFRILFIARQL
jgi:hypothetical protein